MKEPWRERWIHPELKELFRDLKWMVISIVGAGLIAGAINGIYALCEWLKTINVS